MFTGQSLSSNTQDSGWRSWRSTSIIRITR